MDLEKERLHISQLDFELKDLRQQMGLKNQELDRMMAEKMKLNFELKETNRDRLDILTKQEKDLIPEYNSKRHEVESLKSEILGLKKEMETYECNRQEFLRERENNNQILRMSKEEITHLQTMLDDLEKTSSGENIYLLRTKQEQIDELERERSLLDKDRQFFKLKSERLEEQLLSKEKHLLRLEADSKYGTDQTNQALRSENESLRDELLILEKKNLRLQRDSSLLEKYSKKGQYPDMSDHVSSENDRSKQILRRRLDAKIDDISQASANRDRQVARDMYLTES